MQRVNKYFEELLFIQEYWKRILTTKSDKHGTSFPFRVKENVFAKYTISYPMWILNIHKKVMDYTEDALVFQHTLVTP